MMVEIGVRNTGENNLSGGRTGGGAQHTLSEVKGTKTVRHKKVTRTSLSIKGGFVLGYTPLFSA